MTGQRWRGHRRRALRSEADALALLNRALDMAQRRLRYRIGAALLVVATLVAVLVLIR